MKKLFLLSLACITIAFMACKKETVEPVLSNETTSQASTIA